MTTLTAPGDVQITRTGNWLGFPVTIENWQREIERAPNDGNGTDPENADTANSETLDDIDAALERYVDTDAEQGTIYHYRSRIKRGTCAVGPWSDWTAGYRADVLPDEAPPVPTPEVFTVLTWSTEQVDEQTARATLKVFDPELRISALEYKIKQGAGDFSSSWQSGWDSSTGTAGTDTTITRTLDLDLDKKHNTQSKARISYTRRDGISDTEILPSLTSDVDETAEVEKLAGRVNSSGDVLTTGRVDDDGKTTYVTVTTDGTEPSTPTSGNADASTGSQTWTDLDTTVDAEIGDTVRIKARSENDAGRFGPEEEVQFVASRDGPVKVTTDEIDTDADGSVDTGELTITVVAKDGEYDVSFRTKTARGTWQSGGSASGLTQGQTAVETVPLAEKINAKIEYTVTEAGTTNELAGGVVPFDPDDIAHVLSAGISYLDDGTLIASGGADDDTTTIYGNVSTDGTDPGAPTAGSHDFSVNARSFSSKNTGKTLPKGNEGVLKLRGENADGRIAPTDTIKSDTVSRPGPETASEVEPEAELEQNELNTDIDQYGATLRGTAGADVSSPSLEYRTKLEIPGQSASWTSWSTLIGGSAAIAWTRGGKEERTGLAQVRDTSLDNNPTSAVASITVPAQNKGQSEEDGGKLEPSVPYGGSGSGAGEFPEYRRGAERRASRHSRITVRDLLQEEIDRAGFLRFAENGRTTDPVYDETGLNEMVGTSDRKFRNGDLRGGNVEDSSGNERLSPDNRRATGVTVRDNSGNDRFDPDGRKSKGIDVEDDGGVVLVDESLVEGNVDLTGANAQVDGQAASTTRDGAGRANSGLDGIGRLTRDIVDGATTRYDTSLGDLQNSDVDGGSSTVAGQSASTTATGSGRAANALDSSDRLVTKTRGADIEDGGGVVLIDESLTEGNLDLTGANAQVDGQAVSTTKSGADKGETVFNADYTVGRDPHVVGDTSAEAIKLNLTADEGNPNITLIEGGVTDGDIDMDNNQLTIRSFNGLLSLESDGLLRLQPGSSGLVALFGGTPDVTSASAGTNGDVPSQVAGYFGINVQGTEVRVPYYNT